MPIITVNHQQQRFSLQGRAGSSLLEQLYQLPLPLRKSCRNGACGVCRCKLSAGQIDYGHRAPTALWQKDIAAGFILPCIATAKTDITVTDLSLELKK